MRRARSWRSIVVMFALLAATGGSVLAASTSKAPKAPTLGTYLSGKFGQAKVDRFVRDLAAVGIGVYKPRSGSPVQAVKGRGSPMRLTMDQARSAALGIWSHSGLTGQRLNQLAPAVALTPKLKVPMGAVVAGWAKRAQTPSGRLARRILGSPDWKRYGKIVFPHAVLVLFASDVAVHVGSNQRERHPAATTGSNARPCTAVQTFIDGTIDAFFRAIGHIHSDPATIDRLFGDGLFGSIIKGIGDVLSFGVNLAIDAAHTIVVGGVRVATSLITSSITAIAGTIAVGSQIALGLLPWTETLEGSPDPTAKGVGVNGENGEFIVRATALGSNLQWPEFVVDCADAFGLPLPSLTPSNADVTLDVSNQLPSRLLVARDNHSELDRNGRAVIRFETTTESAELARTGELHIGAVVATAKIHRKDLDQLGDRIAQSLLSPLPQIVRDTIGSFLQAQLSTLLAGITAKIASVRDVQASTVERVKYHTPKKRNPPPPPPPPSPGTGHSGFALTTGKPILKFKCTGSLCSALEQGYRSTTGPSYMHGRTCSGSIESKWRGTIIYPSEAFSVPIGFSVPGVGKTANWVDVDRVFGSEDPSTASVHGTVHRAAERTVQFRIHLVGHISHLEVPTDIVEDAEWTGRIVPVSC